MARRNPIYHRGKQLLKKPNRIARTEQVADILHVNVETVRRWARETDIPHDVIVGPKAATKLAAGGALDKISRKRAVYDPKEVKIWYTSQQKEGKRLSLQDRIPLSEGRTRLRAVKKRLNVNTEEFSKLLRVNRSTLVGYLYGSRNKELKTVPASIVKKAENLTPEMVPANVKRIPLFVVKDALSKSRGKPGATAELLGITPTTLHRMADRFGLSDLIQKKPIERITAKQLFLTMKKHDGHMKGVAAELGIARTTLYSLLKKVNLSPKDCRKGSHRTREEVKQALKMHHNNRTLAAKELKIGVEKLRPLIKEYGLKRYFPLINTSKLDPEEVAKVFKRTRYSVGKTAKKLGVSISYMNKYIKSRNLRPTRPFKKKTIEMKKKKKLRKFKARRFSK